MLHFLFDQDGKPAKKKYQENKYLEDVFMNILMQNLPYN
jgi:hypothetical protein